VTRVRPTAVRLALGVALAASTAALAFALRRSPAAALLAVCALGALATALVEWTAMPPRLARLLPRAHVLLLLTGAVVAWLSRSMGVLVLDPALVPLGAGVLLVPLAFAFALAPRIFPAGRTLVPAVIALLAAAGLDPAPPGYGASALPFLRGADHSAFSDVYLPLAVVVLLGLWAAAIRAHGPPWRARDVGLALSLGLGAALAAGGVVGLPLLQPRGEKALASTFDQAGTGLEGESSLGEFAELAVSRRRVLDLRSSDPAAGPWRLPSEVFTRFDGRRWSSGAPRSRRDTPKAALRPVARPAGVDPLVEGLGEWFPGPDGRDPLRDARGATALRIDQAEVQRWPLLVPRGSAALTASAPLLEAGLHGLVRRPRGVPLTQYGAVLDPALAVRPVAAALTDAERDDTIALPPHVDPRVVGLARELARQAEGPRGRLAATVAHLQSHYRYTLAPGAFRTGDPLAEFLFEKRQAYCEYFASAGVVLLRLQGVPARFVKGLSVGPQTDVGGGLHVVRESDAHAWLEAWIPGEGWVEADPTPPGQFASARGGPTALDRLFQRARAFLASAWNRLHARGPVPFLRWLGRELASAVARAAREPLAWAVALVLALGPRLARVWRARARRRREALPAAAVDPRLRALVREVERAWAAGGRPRPPARGLLEHARAVAHGQSVVEAYYRARFGGAEPDGAELRRLREELRTPPAPPS
jgi:transglutaminase-like putative cysteine protease